MMLSLPPSLPPSHYVCTNACMYYTAYKFVWWLCAWILLSLLVLIKLLDLEIHMIWWFSYHICCCWLWNLDFVLFCLQSNLDLFFSKFLLQSRLLKGRSIPGKILLTRRTDPPEDPGLRDPSPSSGRSFSENDAGTSDRVDMSREVI